MKKLKKTEIRVLELFGKDELVRFKELDMKTRTRYLTYYRSFRSCNAKIYSPSEWYIEFIVTTQCVEMLRLQNRFFALVKREISRQDAREYIAYFEAMAYQKERNYRL